MPRTVQCEYQEHLTVHNGGVTLSRRVADPRSIIVYLIEGAAYRRIDRVTFTRDFRDYLQDRLRFDPEDVPDGSIIMVMYWAEFEGRILNVNAMNSPADLEISVNEPLDWDGIDRFYDAFPDSDGPKFDDFAEVLS